MTLTGRRALRLALASVHFLLWLRQLLSSWLRCLWTIGHHLTKHKGTKLSHIVADARRLDKLPSHLALMIGEDTLSLADLASVVCWAVAAGVQFISLYDPKGECLWMVNAHATKKIFLNYLILLDFHCSHFVRGSTLVCMLVDWVSGLDLEFGV